MLKERLRKTQRYYNIDHLVGQSNQKTKHRNQLTPINPQPKKQMIYEWITRRYTIQTMTNQALRTCMYHYSLYSKSNTNNYKENED